MRIVWVTRLLLILSSVLPVKLLRIRRSDGADSNLVFSHLLGTGKNIVDTNFLSDLTSDTIDFTASADCNNFYSSLQLFNTTFANTVDRHAPIITKVIPDNNRPPWMDNEFLDARRTRRRIYKLWKRTRSVELKQELV